MKYFALAYLAFFLLTPGLRAAEESAAPKLIVHFLDVRQGDSTLIQTPGGKTILIDGGQSSTYKSPFDAGGEVILPYLER